jgi:ATP-binding cassette subfamily C (CFTR/MRP) protein 1
MYLAEWVNEMRLAPEDSQNIHILIYCSFVCGAALAFWSRCQSITRATCNSSVYFHDAEFVGLSSTFTSFVDTTPIGKILGRFSRDIDLIDQDLPGAIQDIFSCAAATVGTLCIVIILTPASAPFLLLIIGVFFFIQNRYLPSSNCMKKLESKTRAPIFSFMSQTIIGAETFKAYDKIISCKRGLTQSNRIEVELMEHIDINNRCYFYSFALNRWLGTRVEVVGALIVFVASVGALFLRDMTTPWEERSYGNSWLALGITCTLSISGNMNWLVRQISDLEVQMNAVERVSNFVDLPPEEPLIEGEFQSPEIKHAISRFQYVVGVPNSLSTLLRKRYSWLVGCFKRRQHTDMEELSDIFEIDGWPNSADIRASRLRLRYSPEMPYVLNDVSFSIASGEKIGIVGRTGAGK